MLYEFRESRSNLKYWESDQNVSLHISKDGLKSLEKATLHLKTYHKQVVMPINDDLFLYKPNTNSAVRSKGLT